MTRVVPYVFEVDSLGNHLPGVPLSPALLPNVTANMERAELTAFIRDARAISSDPAVQTQWLTDLHAHARGAADKFLDDYLHGNNSFQARPASDRQRARRLDPPDLDAQLPNPLDRAGARPRRQSER
jgi:type IV secretory pathway TrbF-like protein